MQNILDFEQAMKEKNAVTTRLNGKNYATIAGLGGNTSDIDKMCIRDRHRPRQMVDRSDQSVLDWL